MNTREVMRAGARVFLARLGAGALRARRGAEPCRAVAPMLLAVAMAFGCSHARLPPRATTPSLHDALAPLAHALEAQAGPEKTLLLVDSSPAADLDALSTALRRELAARGITAENAAAPPPGQPFIRLALREREGEDPALLAEAIDEIGERVDLMAAVIPRPILENLATEPGPEVPDGPFARREIGRTLFDAVEVLLLPRPARVMLASPDSILIAPLDSPRTALWSLTNARTLPLPRDPSSLLYRDDVDGDGKEEIVWLSSACSTAVAIRERGAGFESAALPGAPSAGLGAALRPVPGRGYFVAEPSGLPGAALSLEIFDVARGDFDGDGLRETAVARVGEQVRVVSERFPYGAGVDPCGAAVAAADLDGDGTDELVVTAAVPPGERDFLTAYRWDGAEFREIGRTEPLPGLLIAIDAADLNGDGRDEIVALEKRMDENGVTLELYRPAEARP